MSASDIGVEKKSNAPARLSLGGYCRCLFDSWRGIRHAQCLRRFFVAAIEEFRRSRALTSGVLMLGSAMWTLAAPIIGAIALFIGAGSGIGPWLGGAIHDLSGTYRDAFWIAELLVFLSICLIWIAAPRNYRQRFENT